MKMSYQSLPCLLRKHLTPIFSFSCTQFKRLDTIDTFPSDENEYVLSPLFWRTYDEKVEKAIFWMVKGGRAHPTPRSWPKCRFAPRDPATPWRTECCSGGSAQFHHSLPLPWWQDPNEHGTSVGNELRWVGCDDR